MTASTGMNLKAQSRQVGRPTVVQGNGGRRRFGHRRRVAAMHYPRL